MHISNYLFGILTIVAAIGVVVSRRVLNSALSLVGVVCLLSIQYALLGAEFVAMLQLIVYAGAILVLVIFVVMLLGAGAENLRRMPVALGAAAFGLAAVIGVVISSDIGIFSPWLASLKAPGTPDTRLTTIHKIEHPLPPGDVHTISLTLFQSYVYPFQLIGLLLLGAIVGAVVLSYQRGRSLKAGRGLKARREQLTQAKESGDGTTY